MIRSAGHSGDRREEVLTPFGKYHFKVVKGFWNCFSPLGFTGVAPSVKGAWQAMWRLETEFLGACYRHEREMMMRVTDGWVKP